MKKILLFLLFYAMVPASPDIGKRKQVCLGEICTPSLETLDLKLISVSYDGTDVPITSHLGDRVLRDVYADKVENFPGFRLKGLANSSILFSRE